MKAIAAMDEKRGIGFENGLPWKNPIKEDFRWFKEFTTGKILVVGSKTFDTLPSLRNRNVVVLTKYSDGYEDGYDPIYNYAWCYRSYDDIMEVYQCQNPNLICAGGAKTYELFLPLITEFYITHVKGTYDADVFMCSFEELFPHKQLIRELEGGHKIVKYFK